VAVRRLVRRPGLRRAFRRATRALGFDVVRRRYYSPIPDIDSLPDDVWSRRSSLGGVELDAGAQLDFLTRELGPFLSELDAPRSPTTERSRFYLENGSYESVDAELLFAMVRRYKPSRIVEVGSGFSSLVISAALDASRAEGAETRYEIIDPYPASGTAQLGWGETLSRFATLREESVTEVGPDAFAGLGDGDLLFIDSTHTVKLGGDVNRLVLDVLPSLAPGVIIHFHDIFLPFEYPREWLAEEGYYWAEQYLLQAFLAFNRSFEVLAAASLLAADHPDRIGELIPSFRPGVVPGALWLRRIR
jgi:predicted O-methyltransferase YrrM